MMTAEIVRSWAGIITHITDDATGLVVKTRCGRTIKNLQTGYPGEKDCAKCGSEADFEAVWEAKRLVHLEKQRCQEIENAERQARSEARLAVHREAMKQLEGLLKGWGADIEETEERLAGGEIIFSKNGLNFKLFGSIF